MLFRKQKKSKYRLGDCVMFNFGDKSILGFIETAERKNADFNFWYYNIITKDSKYYVSEIDIVSRI